MGGTLTFFFEKSKIIMDDSTITTTTTTTATEVEELTDEQKELKERKEKEDHLKKKEIKYKKDREAIKRLPRPLENQRDQPVDRDYTEEEKKRMEECKQFLKDHFQSWGEEYDDTAEGGTVWNDPKWNKDPNVIEEDPEENKKEEVEDIGLFGAEYGRMWSDDSGSDDGWEKEVEDRWRAAEEKKENREKDVELDEDGKPKEEEKEILLGWITDEKRGVEGNIEQKARDWRFKANVRWHITDEQLPIILDACKLQFNYLLRRLDLDENPISDKGFLLLAEAMAGYLTSEGKITIMPNFERLCVSRCSHMTDVGATAIAESLRTNTMLRQLHMIDNGLSDKTQEAFQEVLRQQRYLECLDLTRNYNMTSYGFIGWVDSLVNNRNLFILELSYMNMDKDVKTALKAMVGTDRFDQKLRKEDFIDLDDDGSAVVKGSSTYKKWEEVLKRRHRSLCYMGIEEEEEEEKMDIPI